MLYDGDCPICQKEMTIVKYLNKKKGTLDLIDINKADFNPSEYGDFSQKELTDVFHVVDSNKQVRSASLKKSNITHQSSFIVT